jgi:hypothetical protein
MYILQVNKKECISTAPLPAGSLLVSGGVKGFVKDVRSFTYICIYMYFLFMYVQMCQMYICIHDCIWHIYS